MNRRLWIALLAFVAASVARAQDDRMPPPQSNANVAADFAVTSAANASLKFSDGLLAPKTEPRSTSASSFAEPSPNLAPADPAPAAPEPKFVYGGRDDFRWQLALGISLVRFRSPFFYATGVGTNTSVTYFTNAWLGVEGSINTAFAPTIYQNEHVKYLGYGGGPKVAWRRAKWEPWAHALVGGMHILPRLATFSKNGFELQVGGGADYRIYPHLSARIEVDWIKTHVFGVWGNSGSANADIVLHF